MNGGGKPNGLGQPITLFPGIKTESLQLPVTGQLENSFCGTEDLEEMPLQCRLIRWQAIGGIPCLRQKAVYKYHG